MAPTDRKSGSRRERRLHGSGARGRGNAEFVARMRSKRILGHQLLCDLHGQRRVNATPDVDLCKFVAFGVGCCAQFLALAHKVGLFAVRLRAD